MNFIYVLYQIIMPLFKKIQVLRILNEIYFKFHSKSKVAGKGLNIL